jgi:FixJ family two-component response regulator
MTDQKYIFLVDDDSSARNGLARLLRKAGHDVLDFASANDFFVDAASGLRGCLVLRMPGMSTDEIKKELNTRRICMPIIVVTADDDPETRDNAKILKAAGFFRKPVDGPALLDAINWALQMDKTDNKLKHKKVHSNKSKASDLKL